MASLKYAENYYTFRNTAKVIGTIISSSSAEEAALEAIEAKLVEANNDYLSRKYQDAIDAYKEAEALIYAQLDPKYPPVRVPGVTLSRDPRLFDPLLSVALEWMNILPVRQSLTSVRPRVLPDATLFGDAAQLDQSGLVNSKLATTAAANASADWQLAKTFTEMGNVKAATFFSNRAKSTDPATVDLLEKSTSATPAPSEPPAARLATGSVSEVARNVTTASSVSVGRTATVMRSVSVEASPTLDRSFGVKVDGAVKSFNWNADSAPPLEDVKAEVYTKRVVSSELERLVFVPISASDVALALPHDYYYVIPLGLAECYHALGDYVNAEKYYFQAASYQYLNKAIEAPYLWQRLAQLYLDWGDLHFRNGNPDIALPIYSNVITPDWKVPTSQIYANAALKPGADMASQVIASLSDVSKLTVNPKIISVILDVQQQILKISKGLDFWGIWKSSVPIWTFDYLQQVAVNFAQLAISAERDVITFWDRADQARLTRQQLSDGVDQANAEANTARMQLKAAQAQRQVYADGVKLAQQRRDDAQNSYNQYKNLAPQWATLQAEQSQISGGDDGDYNQLNAYAQQLLSSGYIYGSRATIAASVGLAGSMLSQQYELTTLQQQEKEMEAALTQAQSELVAAQAGADAAQASLDAANVRAADAANDLAVFDSQTFTPDIWSRLGDKMWGIYWRYFNMALKAARLMQQAYNFETDQSLQMIKDSYATDQVMGLLGADALMADIQSFSYDLVTNNMTKPQPIKQTISLAQRFPFAFEQQFRKTGVMDFTTTLQDFEEVYPGTYAGRIIDVKVELSGIIPPTGVSGTLTNTGISTYRIPLTLWAGDNNGRKFRVQPRETLVISDYDIHADALVNPIDSRMMRIFEGAGVASDWHLEIPPSVNDLDYSAIIDVKLTFSYKARYDPTMHDQVLQQIANRAGNNARQRGIPLRWIFPDAFFSFQKTGSLRFSLMQRDFPINERQPTITGVGVVVATANGLNPGGITFRLTSPSHAALAEKTDQNGAIDSNLGGSAWAPLASGSALGEYKLEVLAADNPALVKDGALDLAGIANIALVLGYNFTPRK